MLDSGEIRESKTTPQGRVGVFHFPAARLAPSSYRLVALLTGGRRVLVRLARSPAEAWRRPLPLADQVRGEVLDLALERWSPQGGWEAMPGPDTTRPRPHAVPSWWACQ